MSTHTMINWKPENVVRQLPWRLDSKAALGFLLILAIFSLVGWLYLSQASAVTTTRYRIDELRLELDHLENQNAALALEIAQLENLARIETRAPELGLGPTTNVRYLPVAHYPLPAKIEGREVNVAETEYIAAFPVSLPESPSPMADWWVDTLDSFTAWLVEE
ncbi:MAG: cell division protein FtsL [Anaerolineae bacterium]|nr:cell division protein FtsL [Anaerolineae bacterium]